MQRNIESIMIEVNTAHDFFCFQNNQDAAKPPVFNLTNIALHHPLEKEEMAYIQSFLNERPYIKALNLNGNKLSLDALTLLNQCDHITVLSLCHCNIDDDGAKLLAENIRVTSLDLAINNIGDEGTIALSNNKTLRMLNLRNNCIGPAGANAFTTNITLSKLDVSGNNIDTHTAKTLAKTIQDKAECLSKAEIEKLTSTLYAGHTSDTNHLSSLPYELLFNVATRATANKPGFANPEKRLETIRQSFEFFQFQATSSPVSPADKPRRSLDGTK